MNNPLQMLMGLANSPMGQQVVQTVMQNPQIMQQAMQMFGGMMGQAQPVPGPQMAAGPDMGAGAMAPGPRQYSGPEDVAIGSGQAYPEPYPVAPGDEEMPSDMSFPNAIMEMLPEMMEAPDMPTDVSASRRGSGAARYSGRSEFPTNQQDRSVRNRGKSRDGFGGMDGELMDQYVKSNRETGDVVREETEAEMAAVADQMGHEWEGNRKDGPSPADILYARENPTDGILEDFEARFGYPINVNAKIDDDGVMADEDDLEDDEDDE